MNRMYTLILVAVLVLLGGYIFYTQNQSAPSTSASTTPSPTPVPVLSFLSDNVAKFQVRDLKNNQTTLVTRQSEQWHMEQPKDSDTSKPKIEGLLIQLAQLEAQRAIPNVSDLAPYGLASPAFEARATMKDNSEYVLLVGDQNPDKTYYYMVKPGDNTVYLVRSGVGDTIQQFVTQPPFPPTVTPTPLPTLTPSATPNATEQTTPEATPTP